MTFSIIVGTFNQKNTLGVTLEYLYNQTFKDFEVLVCDDGSDYNVEEEFSDWKGKLNIKFFTQEHKGMRLSKNLNQGIKEAKGQYITVIMGDSFPDILWLEELRYAVSAVNIISSFRVYVDDTFKRIGYDWRFNKDPKELPDIIDANPEHPWTDMTGNGLVVPRRFYQQVGNWPEAYEGYGRDDWSLILKAKKLGYRIFTDTQAIIFHIGKVDVPDNPKNIELFEKEFNEN
ncbi:MAG: glycosyltransferase family 2 protein [Nitrospiria bacterium]